MNKALSSGSSNAGAATRTTRSGTKFWPVLGFAGLVIFCSAINGCATDTASTRNDAGSLPPVRVRLPASSQPLVGPEYYQSNDNPFHAD